MVEVADIFRQHSESYLEKYGSKMLPSHKRVIADIIACRTAALGGELYECDHCHEKIYAYHSCKNRSCPKCHTKQIQQWVEKRQSELLPCNYFHITFTLPDSLHALFRSNQKVCYDILMKSAYESLLELAKDPKYCGGLVGILSVLHTWTQTLSYHPHVHCLVTAGGVNAQGDWCPSREKYLVCIYALSDLFRGKCLAALRKAFPNASLNSPPQWNVYSKPWGQGETAVLEYLARYVFRSAISNNRILSLDEHEVKFKYKNRDTNKWQICVLSPEQFMQRFLQHVLPKGFHKVRYSGLWHPSKAPLVKRVRYLLQMEQPLALEEKQSSEKQDQKSVGVFPDALCPHCKKGHLVLKQILYKESAMGP